MIKSNSWSCTESWVMEYPIHAYKYSLFTVTKTKQFVNSDTAVRILKTPLCFLNFFQYLCVFWNFHICRLSFKSINQFRAAEKHKAKLPGVKRSAGRRFLIRCRHWYYAYFVSVSQVSQMVAWWSKSSVKVTNSMPFECDILCDSWQQNFQMASADSVVIMQFITVTWA